MKNKSFLILLCFLSLSMPFQACADTIIVKDMGTMDFPLDPNYSELWKEVPRVVLNLEKQTVVKPKGGGAISGLQVQAAHNATHIAFLLQWKDKTANWERMIQFGDSVAIQFPSSGLGEGSSFMGDELHMVNIWQWKADWERDVQEGYQGVQTVYPKLFVNHITPDLPDYVAQALGNANANRAKRSPVANLLAKGFGTLTHIKSQNISGHGEHDGSLWKVIFLRSLKTFREGEAQFEKGGKNYAAFAVWEGYSNERNGIKSFTKNWINLVIE